MDGLRHCFTNISLTFVDLLDMVEVVDSLKTRLVGPKSNLMILHFSLVSGVTLLINVFI